MRVIGVAKPARGGPPWRPLRGLAIALALVICLCGSALASAPRGAWEQVWRSDAATRGLSLSGTARTTALGERGERSALARVSVRDGKTRLDYEAGRRRWSLIDDGRSLVRLDPDHKQALVLPRPSLVVDRQLAERNYEAVAIGQATIAGRAAQIIEVRARRPGPRLADTPARPGPARPGVIWRLWLDQETSFALKRERYNAEGKLTSGTEYAEVEFGARVDTGIFAIPDGWRVMDADGGGEPLSMAEIERRLGFSVLAPGYVPPGYQLTGGYLRRRDRRGFQAAELRYTDGLRVLSVFQRERERGEREGRGGEHGRARRHGGERGRGEGDDTRDRDASRGRPHGHGGERGRGAPEDRRDRGGSGLAGAGGTTLLDRGSEKALHYLGADRVVVVIGDLPAEELMRVARSVAR